MAYIGKGDCPNCGREVDVSTNVRGMAYFRCAPCGFKGQQTTERGNRKFLEAVRMEATEERPEPATQEPRESREIAEPTPAPAGSQKAAKRGGSIFGFGG